MVAMVSGAKPYIESAEENKVSDLTNRSLLVNDKVSKSLRNKCTVHLEIMMCNTCPGCLHQIECCYFAKETSFFFLKEIK